MRLRKFSLKWIPTVAILSSLAWAGCFLDNAQSQGSKATTVTTPTPKPTPQAISDLKQTPPLDPAKLGQPLPANLWIELSKLVNPAVVSITTAAAVNPRGGRGYRDPIQDFFEEFYGGQVPGAPQGRSARPREQMMGLGTGFIIREDGLIITNNHVVEQADIIKVQLDASDEKLYEAEVIGRDSRTDIALIKIDAKKKLPVAQLGDSKNVQVGEYVAAFGNPYGHAHTMTIGIVSAIGRAIAEINRFPFIQTDASINPGNSGGPLVNAQGYVIGVNTAIDARAQGIGFAIPIDDVKNIVAQLEKEGRIRRGFIGVGIATVDEDIAAQLGMSESPRGVLVTQVLRGGPADKAGIKPYDVIIEFDGKKTNTSADLQNSVGDLKIGGSGKAKVWRFDERGRRKDFTYDVKIEENPDDIRKAPAQKQYFGQNAPFDLGFKVSNHSAELAREFGIPTQAPKGPIVTDVTRGSSSSRSGLMVGDIFLDVNRQPVTNTRDVLKLLKKGRNFVRVVRGYNFVVLTLGE
ncbi:MAG: trypsin-like peptidase domain-containing protein [Bdellovibrionota bacterium]